jgi:hypothetical protein
MSFVKRTATTPRSPQLQAKQSQLTGNVLRYLEALLSVARRQSSVSGKMLKEWPTDECRDDVTQLLRRNHANVKKKSRYNECNASGHQ